MTKNSIMVIQKVENLGKGIHLEVIFDKKAYSLIINTEQTWFSYDGYENGYEAWTGISDEKLIKKLNRAWLNAQFLG